MRTPLDVAVVPRPSRSPRETSANLELDDPIAIHLVVTRVKKSLACGDQLPVT